MNYQPDMRLKKNNQGLSSFSNFKGQTSEVSLRYKPLEDKKVHKGPGSWFIHFILKDGIYQGEKEPVVINGVMTPRFGIFSDIIDFLTRKMEAIYLDNEDHVVASFSELS